MFKKRDYQLIQLDYQLDYQLIQLDNQPTLSRCVKLRRNGAYSRAMDSSRGPSLPFSSLLPRRLKTPQDAKQASKQASKQERRQASVYKTREDKLAERSRKDPESAGQTQKAPVLLGEF